MVGPILHSFLRPCTSNKNTCENNTLHTKSKLSKGLIQLTELIKDCSLECLDFLTIIFSLSEHVILSSLIYPSTLKSKVYQSNLNI